MDRHVDPYTSLGLNIWMSDTLTLSTWMSRAEDRLKFSNFFSKFFEIQISIAFFGFSKEKYIQIGTNKPSIGAVVLHIAPWICRNIFPSSIFLHYFSVKSIIACIKGHLEPTHLKSSPLLTFSTKSVSQESPSIHLFSKIIGSRFTTPKNKVRWRFTKLICFF